MGSALSDDLLHRLFLELYQRFDPVFDKLEEGSVADQGHLHCFDVACSFLVFGKAAQEGYVVHDCVGNCESAYPILLAEEVDAVLYADAAVTLAKRSGGEADEANATVGCACGSLL